MKRQFNSKLNSGYDKYVPQGIAKFILYLSVFSGLVSMVSVFLAGFMKDMIGVLFIVTLVTFGIAILGGIFITVDIIRFNRKQKKIANNNKKFSKTDVKENDGPDMVRMLNFVAGLALGVIIGYLKWGIK